VEVDFEKSDYVFEGTITAHEIVWVMDTLYPITVTNGLVKGDIHKRDSVLTNRYTLEIQKTYKGKIHRKIVFIYSDFPSLECGFPFIKGQKYIVLASKNIYVEWGASKEIEKRLKVGTSDCGFTSLYTAEKSNIIKQLSRKKKRLK
jgi:hypothetical protein